MTWLCFPQAVEYAFKLPYALLNEDSPWIWVTRAAAIALQYMVIRWLLALDTSMFLKLSTHTTGYADHSILP